MKKEATVIAVMITLLFTLIVMNIILIHHSIKLSQENADLEQALQMQCDYVKQIEAHEAPYGE